MNLLRDKLKRDTYMVSKLCRMIARGDLRDNHPQQRKSGQWDITTRDNFIVTVIKNEDFDPIKICEQLTDEGIVLWLIDGLQRSTTIENYKSGKFKLGRNIDPYTIEYQESVKVDGKTVYQNVVYDLRGKAYKDLPEKLKEDFDNCPVDVRKHLDCTDEEVGRHIIRYNSGRAMVVPQKIVAYMHNIAKDIKQISGHAFFNDCINISETKDRNGELDKVVCECLMGINFFDSWNKNAQKMGQFLNNNATDEMFELFNNYLDRLLNVVTPKTGELFATKKSTKNCIIWMMLFDKFAKTGLTDDKFKTFLENFDKLKNIKVEVENEYELEKNSGVFTNILSFSQIDGVKSTKDKGIMRDKLHILETVMNEFLHISAKSIVEESIEEIQNYNIEEVSTLDFVKENVKSDATEEDVEFYSDILDDLTLEVDNNTKLLDEHNRPSLVALVGYACENDCDDLLNEWIKQWFAANTTYILNQKDNYINMVSSLQSTNA